MMSGVDVKPFPSEDTFYANVIYISKSLLEFLYCKFILILYISESLLVVKSVWAYSSTEVYNSVFTWYNISLLQSNDAFRDVFDLFL